MSKSRQQRYKGDVGFSTKSEFSDRSIGATTSFDWSNGRRGMAKDVRGAKKFVRSRIRAADKMKIKSILKEGFEQDAHD